MHQVIFSIRNADFIDIGQLVELEKQWPETARASEAELIKRLSTFKEGFFIAEDTSGIIASIICYPYFYKPDDLSNFQNWENVVSKCFQHNDEDFRVKANALYIVSGTTKPTQHGSELFDGGVNHVVALAKAMGKQFVVGGCLLPGYARYMQKHEPISADNYVFKTIQGRHVDPLLEKYRRLDFFVPDKNHVIPNYYQNEQSLNYSALVVRDLYK